MKLLDRLFSFLTVQDPRQTRVNKVLFGMIVCWIGFGSIINTVNMVVYYWPEWTETTGMVQHSAFFSNILFQSEGISKLTDWEKILIGAISSLVAVIGAMALFLKSTLKYIADDKDKREANVRADNAEALEVISNNSRVIEGIEKFLEERLPKRR